MCAIPKCSARRTAWVPLPEPGAPISSRRIALLRSARAAAGRRRVGQARILPPRVSGVSQASMDGMWADLLPVGRDSGTGGYRRYAWTPADLACREWFAAEAARRGLDLVVDRNGNQWAWWGDPDADGPGVVTGSHLDSVPDGGAFDGPLGVVGGVRRGRPAARARASRPPGRSGVASFTDEEGARFGVACAGSRLLTGALDARPGARRSPTPTARRWPRPCARPGTTRRTSAATTRRCAASAPSSSCTSSRAVAWSTDGAAGRGGPQHLAARPVAARPRRRGQPRRHHPARATGTTRCCRLAARGAAPPARRPSEHGAVATIGRVRVAPERRQRHPLAGRGLAGRARRRRGRRARPWSPRSPPPPAPRRRSRSPGRRRSSSTAALRDRLAGLLGGAPGAADRRRPRRRHPRRRRRRRRAMLFVRNPTGVCHSPAEHAEPDDCRAGVEALATVLADLTGSVSLTTYHADLAWLPPGRLARDVHVDVEDGRVAQVTEGAAAAPAAERLPGLVLPGLANAHSHAFHRALRGRTQRGTGGQGSFWTWREQMYAVAGRLDPDSYLALARAAYAEMVLAGVTAVGEFHYLHHAPGGERYDDPNAMGHALVQAAREAGLRITLLDTCYLAGGIGEPLAGVQQRFGDGDADGWAARVERSGAAVRRAARRPGRRGGALGARRAGRPARHRGRLGRPARGAAARARLRAAPGERRPACRPTASRRPGCCTSAALLGPRSTAVHATHLTDDDIDLLGRLGHRGVHVPDDRARPGRRRRAGRPGPRGRLAGHPRLGQPRRGRPARGGPRGRARRAARHAAARPLVGRRPARRRDPRRPRVAGLAGRRGDRHRRGRPTWWRCGSTRSAPLAARTPTPGTRRVRRHRGGRHRRGGLRPPGGGRRRAPAARRRRAPCWTERSRPLL